SQGAPAVQGMPAGGAANLTVEAKWLGACKADQKPGDMIMAGGQQVNIRDLQNMPGMPGGAKKEERSPPAEAERTVQPNSPDCGRAPCGRRRPARLPSPRTAPRPASSDIHRGPWSR